MPVFQRSVAPSGEIGNAIDQLKTALGVPSMPVEHSKNDITNIEFTKEYSERLIALWGDQPGQLREHFNRDFCQLPAGGFVDEVARSKWSQLNPWCPIPPANTVRGSLPNDADGYLAALGLSCESWNRFATAEARTLHVRSSSRLKERLGITGVMTVAQGDAIRAAIDARCASSPGSSISRQAPPVFRSEAARTAWIADPANAGAPTPPAVVPCPPAPSFASQYDRDQWMLANTGCIAPAVRQPNRTLLYVAGGIGVAGLAWWFLRAKKK
jgi:hypothetical protein